MRTLATSYVNDIAQLSAAGIDSSFGQLNYRYRPAAHGSKSPRPQGRKVNDPAISVEIHHVDGKAHEEAMHPMTRQNPQSLAGNKLGCIETHQSAEARPVAVRNGKAIRQSDLPGAVERGSCN
jgi:hypothetical protein